MKKLIGILGMMGMIGCCDKVGTKIVLRNGDTSNVVTWVTLGGGLDSNVWVQDLGDLGIGSGLTGSLVLGVGDSLVLEPRKAIQGNVCFLTQAYQCLDSARTGCTLMEFCLNNKGTVKNAQETVDISCVAGVTYIGKMKMWGGGIWTANAVGYDTVVVIENSIYGRNGGRVGVYPVGCDNCVKSTDPPSCVKKEACSEGAICQVQRGADKSGGVVVIEYVGPAYSILK